MIKTAEISECGKYRYSLSRIWMAGKPTILFIGHNPSKADAENDDNTITRLIGFASDLGYGGFHICNISPYRATDKKDILQPLPKDVMEYAENHIRYLLARECVIVICCWGNSTIKDMSIVKILPKDLCFCFGKNKNGSPKHPLYLKSDTQLIKF